MPYVTAVIIKVLIAFDVIVSDIDLHLITRTRTNKKGIKLFTLNTMNVQFVGVIVLEVWHETIGGPLTS